MTTKKLNRLTVELMDMMEKNPHVKSLLIKSIEKAKIVNPDKNSNPVQSLDEYYRFVEWSVRAMPWTILNVHKSKLYERIDQSLIYFYFICDQPLEELEGNGKYFNSLQYIEPFRTWLIDYTKNWGRCLSTKMSWSLQYYRMAYRDKRFGLQNGWYEDHNNWKTFNDFFSRYLSSPKMRPVSEPDDDSVVVSAADSVPEGKWSIDNDSYIVQNDGLLLKSKYFDSIETLLGPDSSYGNKFANGILTHSFLDVNDYHRFHFPVNGIIREMISIKGDNAGGGNIIWDPQAERYILISDNSGWQMIESRAVVIVETEKYGIMALLPIGMSQVNSVNFEKNLKVGDKVKKGDMLGYFLFGGSDFVILFQGGVNFELTVQKDITGKYRHILMGEELGRFR